MKFTEEYQVKLKAASEILGYESLPPTIEEFLTDEYYLGNTKLVQSLYPHWRELLIDLFPTPIHTKYPFIILTGAIGTGKSSFSKIVSLYNECRLAHLKDLRYFDIGISKEVVLLYTHTTLPKAYSDFIESVKFIGKDSPYFTKLWSHEYENKIPVIHKADSYTSNSAIGGDIMVYVLSEMNFVGYDRAYYKLDQAFKRWKSRFAQAYGYLGNIIIDTSAQGDNSITENFINDNPYENIKIVRTSIWDAKKHTGYYFNSGYFTVYTGDSINPPYIITEDKPLTEKHDADRVIKCPMELYPEAKTNLESFLQDSAGISTVSTGKYMNDPDPLKKACILPYYLDKEFAVDQFDTHDRIIDHLREQLSLVPKDRPLFIRFDLGIVNDECGIAITHFDGYKEFTEGSKLRLPTFKTPLITGMTRLANQQSSISHVHEFCLDLRSEGYEIASVSFDQYQSTQIRQDLERNNIDAKLMSVDRKDTAYILFKSLVNNEQWQGSQDEDFIFNTLQLEHKDGKVDHKPQYKKDRSDAVVGSVMDCYDNLDKATDIPAKKKVMDRIQGVKSQMTARTGDVQNIVQNIYSNR